MYETVIGDCRMQWTQCSTELEYSWGRYRIVGSWWFVHLHESVGESQRRPIILGKFSLLTYMAKSPIYNMLKKFSPLCSTFVHVWMDGWIQYFALSGKEIMQWECKASIRSWCQHQRCTSYTRMSVSSSSHCGISLWVELVDYIHWCCHLKDRVSHLVSNLSQKAVLFLRIDLFPNGINHQINIIYAALWEWPASRLRWQNKSVFHLK